MTPTMNNESPVALSHALSQTKSHCEKTRLLFLRNVFLPDLQVTTIEEIITKSSSDT